jgi:hypothetical protein
VIVTGIVGGGVEGATYGAGEEHSTVGAGENLNGI